MKKTNQLIKGVEKLPKGYEWKIKNYYLPDGICKCPRKFKDFGVATWKAEICGYHLFELSNGKTPVMAYCLIVKSKR